MVCFLNFLCFLFISKGSSDVSFDKVIKWWGSHLLWSQGLVSPSLKSISFFIHFTFFFLFRVSVSPSSPVCSLVIWCGAARYGRSKSAICGLSASHRQSGRWNKMIYNMHIRERGRPRVKEKWMESGQTDSVKGGKEEIIKMNN